MGTDGKCSPKIVIKAVIFNRVRGGLTEEIEDTYFDLSYFWHALDNIVRDIMTSTGTWRYGNSSLIPNSTFTGASHSRTVTKMFDSSN